MSTEMVITLTDPIQEEQSPAQAFFANLMNRITSQGDTQLAALEGMKIDITQQLLSHKVSFNIQCSKLDATQAQLEKATEKLASLETSNSRLERAQVSTAVRMEAMEQFIASISPNFNAHCNTNYTIPAPSNPTIFPSMPTMGSVAVGAAVGLQKKKLFQQPKFLRSLQTPLPHLRITPTCCANNSR